MDFIATAAIAFKDTKTTAITLGVATVVITNTYSLLYPSESSTFSALNLAGAGAIVYGSFF